MCNIYGYLSENIPCLFMHSSHYSSTEFVYTDDMFSSMKEIFSFLLLNGSKWIKQ